MYIISLIAVSFLPLVWGYLGETFAPFTISLAAATNEPFILKPGDTIQITWGMTPGVRFPIYGYASSKTAKTDVGLLLPEASRTDEYTHLIDTELSLANTNQYTWIVPPNIPSGKYHIGIGFFYHEKSTEFITIQNDNSPDFILQDAI